jgi:hypothetical protein
VQESRNKRKVHRIELWEAAHKKKNGRFTTEKVETLMVHIFSRMNELCLICVSVYNSVTFLYTHLNRLHLMRN